MVRIDPGGGVTAAWFTERAAGSTSTDQTSPKLLSRCRFLRVTVTGADGHGSRTDS
jgi:hypothetical protein